jgi:hypothetical protein
MSCWTIGARQLHISNCKLYILNALNLQCAIYNVQLACGTYVLKPALACAIMWYSPGTKRKEQGDGA